jgi:YD repeat-containing protein
VTDYQYDGIYRLVQEKITDAQGATQITDYAYDKVGNRSRRTVSPAAGLSSVTIYDYDANDRLIREQTSQGASTAVTTYEYDANGNTVAKLTGLSATLYVYDAENRLVEVERGPDAQSAQTVASYAYDGNGNRVTKAEPTAEGLKVTTFLVDESQQYAQVVEEREEVAEQPAQVTVAYVYGDDLLNQLRGGQRTYYHYDGLGSTRALSDGGGHIPTPIGMRRLESSRPNRQHTESIASPANSSIPTWKCITLGQDISTEYGTLVPDVY